MQAQPVIRTAYAVAFRNLRLHTVSLSIPLDRPSSFRLLPNQALHSDRGWRLGLQGLSFRVPAQAPAPFSAPPRSVRVGPPRRVNAHIVRQPGLFTHVTVGGHLLLVECPGAGYFGSLPNDFRSNTGAISPVAGGQLLVAVIRCALRATQHS